MTTMLTSARYSTDITLHQSVIFAYLQRIWTCASALLACLPLPPLGVLVLVAPPLRSLSLSRSHTPHHLLSLIARSTIAVGVVCCVAQHVERGM
jgi:hypothetical protein